MTTEVDTGVLQPALADLAKATPKSEIKQRQAMKSNGQPVGKPDGTPLMLDYVDARFVQDRLDSVVGPANWQSKFEDIEGGTRCGIGILIMGIGWIWKWDVGTPSNIEPVKGAHSDAFKRAAVQWGVARDLYGTPDETDVVIDQPTVRQQTQGNGRGTRYAGQGTAPTAAPAQQWSQDELEEVAADQGLAWDCPLHGGHKIVPPGKGKAPPHKPYGAFFACNSEGPPYCNEKGPRVETA